MALKDWNNSDISKWLEMKEMNRKILMKPFSRNEFNDQICSTRRLLFLNLTHRNSFEEDYLIVEWKFVIESEFKEVNMNLWDGFSENFEIVIKDYNLQVRKKRLYKDFKQFWLKL